MTLLAVFLALVFLQSLGARRLERTVVTAPILFTVGGMLAAVPGTGGKTADLGLFLAVAEIGLVLLLFTDASRADLRVLKDIRRLPARLLSIGLLLTIALGALGAKLVFPALSVWEAGILAAILAPTDAGLGQVIVTSPRVPERVRQALNVEAGLNDGLSVPFFLFFLALARPGASEGGASLARFIVEQLGYGAAVGLGLGLPGGALLSLARRKGWAAESATQLGMIALPLLSIVACEAVHASMFIAAFVAGLAVQVRFREASHGSEFAEHSGQLLNHSVFFLFGALLAGSCGSLTPRLLLYAALSLTVVRIVPVALALLGSGVSRATVAFMGWFGPRGLASIVLGLVFLEHSEGKSPLPGEETIRLAVMATVFLSVLAHGLTALPGISLYAKSAERLPATAPEIG